MAQDVVVDTSNQPRILGKGLYLSPLVLRLLATVAVFRPGLLQGGSMSLRALLYRRPSEPSVVQVVFDQAIYLVRLRRHRQARRYTLRIDAPAREVVLTMPPRGSIKEAKEFAQKHGGWIAARLKRLPEVAPFAHGVDVPLRGEPHRIVNRRTSTAASATSSGARRSATSRPRAGVAPTSSGFASSAFACATSRAVGVRARIRAHCRFPGGSFSRPHSCSTTLLRTRSAISWSSIIRRDSGGW